MSSQASSAGRDEAIVRQKLIETCAVERCPDRADPAIHHVAWRYHIGPGRSV